MTYSPLSVRSVSCDKYSSRQGNPITRLIIHHTTSTSNVNGLNYLVTTPRQVSATYCLLTTGELVGVIPEEHRPWTTGWTADKEAVTVECINAIGSPTWEVSPAQLEMLAKLAADLSIRYGWGPLNRQRVSGHKDWADTSCPGPFLYPKLELIISRANAILGTSKPPTPVTPPVGNISLAEADRLVNEIIRGSWGNGQDRINRLTAAGYSMDQIIALQTEVTRRLTTQQSSLKPISVIATQVIRGDWGNGQDRRRRLKAAGYDPDVVQAEVNRQLNS